MARVGLRNDADAVAASAKVRAVPGFAMRKSGFGDRPPTAGSKVGIARSERRCIGLAAPEKRRRVVALIASSAFFQRFFIAAIFPAACRGSFAADDAATSTASGRYLPVNFFLQSC